MLGWGQTLDVLVGTEVKGVGETAAVKGKRATHFKLSLTLKIGGSLGQLLSTY